MVLECESGLRGPLSTLTERELVALEFPSQLKSDKHGLTELRSEVCGSQHSGQHECLEQSPSPSREGSRDRPVTTEVITGNSLGGGYKGILRSAEEGARLPGRKVSCEAGASAWSKCVTRVLTGAEGDGEACLAEPKAQAKVQMSTTSSGQQLFKDK